MAHRHGASLLLRIDDLDRERFREEYLTDIFDTLHFLGIGWDEGPKNEVDFHSSWSQLHRMGLYKTALAELRHKELVFGCSCSRSDLTGFSGYPGNCVDRGLDLDKSESAWRLNPFACDKLSMTAPDGIRTEQYLPSQMKGTVVRKKDGVPSYQLASVVDDDYFGVDLIVRGNDLFPSTLFQLCISGHLANSRFGSNSFFHHPLLTDAHGGKLSKSAGSESIMALRATGASRSEVLRMIVNRAGGTGAPEHWMESFNCLTEVLKC